MDFLDLSSDGDLDGVSSQFGQGLMQRIVPVVAKLDSPPQKRNRRSGPIIKGRIHPVLGRRVMEIIGPVPLRTAHCRWVVFPRQPAVDLLRQPGFPDPGHPQQNMKLRQPRCRKPVPLLQLA